jgi:hypothetical protein
LSSNRKQAYFHSQIMMLRIQAFICLVCGGATLLMYLGLVIWQAQGAREAIILLKMAATCLVCGVLASELGREIEHYLLKRELLSPTPGGKGLLHWIKRINPPDSGRSTSIPG